MSFTVSFDFYGEGKEG